MIGIPKVTSVEFLRKWYQQVVKTRSCKGTIGLNPLEQ